MASACILQPLLRAGFFTPGTDKLSCSVGGVTYTADLGDSGDIRCNCGCQQVYRSPSAYSIHIKRKVNPNRKADDGWQSTRYEGISLSCWRGELEKLLKDKSSTATELQIMDGTRSGGCSSPVRASIFSQVLKHKRKGRAARSSPPNAGNGEGGDSEHAVSGSGKQIHHGQLQQQQQDQQQQQQQLQQQWFQQHLQQQWLWGQQQNEGMPGGPAGAESAGGCEQQEEGSNLLEHTWVQSSSARYNTSRCCPQELPGPQVDSSCKLQLQEEASFGHAAASTRPPLLSCSEADFAADLIAFLVDMGDEQLAASVRDKRITCNNTPLDLFGLYREVVLRGGLEANERYDERGRWCGGINFAGDIFPRLTNYTPNNRATSVGNQLLNNYKKFLLAYERAHRTVDIPAAAAAAGGAWSEWMSYRGRWGGAGSLTGSDYFAAQTEQAHDPLAFLAEVAGATAAPFSLQPQCTETAAAAAASESKDRCTELIDATTAASERPSKKQRSTEEYTGSSSYTPDVGQEGTAADGVAVPDVIWQQPDVHSEKQQQHQQQQQQVQRQDDDSSRSPQVLQHSPVAGAGHSSGSGSNGSSSSSLQCSIEGTAQYVQSPQAAAAAATTARQEAGAGTDTADWCMPGSLLLIHQQEILLSQGTGPAGWQQLCWAAVVADVSQLPAQVAEAGGTTAASTDCQGPYKAQQQQQQQQQHKHDDRQLPVLLLGTHHLVWVSRSCCNPFDLTDAQAALVAAWSTLNPQLPVLPGVAGRLQQQWGVKETQLQLQLASLRGLKQAMQWASSCNNGGSCSCSIPACQLADQPSRWVVAAGVAAVAQQLLLLEGQLPPGVFVNQSSCYWEAWRAAVDAASSPEQLALQVSEFAYQLDAMVLMKGVAADALWAQLQPLLGVTPCATAAAKHSCDSSHPGSTQQQHVPGSRLAAQAAAGAVATAAAAVDMGAATVLSVSEAVRIVAAAIDWPQLHHHHGMWLVGPAQEAGLMPAGGFGRQHSATGSTAAAAAAAAAAGPASSDAAATASRQAVQLLGEPYHQQQQLPLCSVELPVDAPAHPLQSAAGQQQKQELVAFLQQQQQQQLLTEHSCSSYTSPLAMLGSGTGAGAACLAAAATAAHEASLEQQQQQQQVVELPLPPPLTIPALMQPQHSNQLHTSSLQLPMQQQQQLELVVALRDALSGGSCCSVACTTLPAIPGN